MTFESSRRNLLRESISVVGAMVASATIACLGQPRPLFAEAAQQSDEDHNKNEETEVTATEDLMREHGVIRRALLVYYEVIPNLRQNPGSVDASAIRQAAQLFRTFGEDYHERMLEEQHIFPIIRKQGTAALKRYADISHATRGFSMLR